MLPKRIIPCLDISDGRVVKGINFANLLDLGDPIKTAEEYNRQGADEIVFLDIKATDEAHIKFIDIIKNVAKKDFAPITVGGGIRSVKDFEDIFKAGAKKVSINSAAVKDKTLIQKAAEKFGSDSIIVAIDTKKIDGSYNVMINGGRTDTGLNAVEWALEAEKLGAGEILLTSMDADGVKNGYDIEITKIISSVLNIPVIASGGCGSLKDFLDLFQKTNASAALAASVFHNGKFTVKEVKEYLETENINVTL